MNRSKWETLARLYPDISLTVVMPTTWPDVLFTVHAGDVSSQTSNCSFVSLPVRHAGNEPKHTYRWRDLTRIIRATAPDIIHVEQGTLAMSHLQISLLAKLYAPRAKILFFTWINWHEPRKFLSRLRWSWVERLTCAFSQGAVVGNQAAQVVLRDKNFTKPVTVIPQLGADCERYCPVPGAREKTVLFLGRLVPEKGVLLLRDAWKQLGPEFPDWKLQFVGSGPCAEQLRDFVIPAVPHEKIPELLNRVSVLVLPSYDTPTWKEQFGLVLAEAMACKVPVIGSSAGAIPEVIGDAGLIFEQNNVADLVRCLRMFMQDQLLRAQYAQLGYQRAHEQLSRQAIAHQTVQFWKVISCQKE